MRWTGEQGHAIVDETARCFGPDVRVRLFGSCASDEMRR